MKTMRLNFILGALGLVLAAAVQAQNSVRYESQPGGKIKMEGTSTIHDWSMRSGIIVGFIETDADFPESAKGAASVRPKCEISIPVRTFKSGHTKMDEVMQEHMNMAKYPRMEYRLIELKPKSVGDAKGAVPFDAIGALTIAGITRTNTMPVTIEKTDKGKIKVTGSTPLKMTDFGVQPPAPSILGMPVIKTGDDLKITFEWLAAEKQAGPAK